MTKLSSNQILCSAKKIGYTSRNFVEYSFLWKNTIFIKFDITKMQTADLFLIVMSYVHGREVFLTNILTAGLSDKVNIFSNEQSNNFYKMSYKDFENWWEGRHWYDSCLIKEIELYGLVFIFVPELVKTFCQKYNLSDEEFSLSYKPSYPWNYELIEIIEKNIDVFNEEIFWEKSHIYEFKKKPVRW